MKETGSNSISNNKFMRFAYALALVGSVFGAQSAHASDQQYWQTATATVALPENFKLSAEVVARTSDPRGFYELEQNYMAGYKVTKKVTAWLGYTRDPNYLHGTFTVMEQRFRQQVTADNMFQVGPAKISGRMRLEERWRAGIDGTGWRLRPYVKATIPAFGKTSLVLSHESFIDLSRTSFQKVSGYERMRNAISLSMPLNKNFTVDIGYLNQHGFVRGGPDTSDNVLTTGVSASF